MMVSDADDNASTNSKVTRDSPPGDPTSHYPRPIKMEEKRDRPGAKVPYCQQMRVTDGGYVTPLPNTVNINEDEPRTSAMATGQPASRSDENDSPRRLYGGLCYCASLWG